MENITAERFVVRPFAGIMAGVTLAGWYVHDTHDDTARSDLYASLKDANDYRDTLQGAQRAIDATFAAGGPDRG